MKFIVETPEGKKIIMEMEPPFKPLPEGYKIYGAPEESPDLLEQVEGVPQAEKDRAWAKRFLKETDYKVTRHRDQVDLGCPTKLSAEEYMQLLLERQTAREKI
jgi:hypothetical protein